jgi:sugar phosphate isomerase/epimerase
VTGAGEQHARGEDRPRLVSKLELCWGTLERASLIELLGAADRTGYDTVAVSPHSYLRLSARRARAVRSFLASHPLRVHVVDAIIGGLPGSPPADRVDPRFRHFFEYSPRQVFDMAGALDGDVVNIAHFLGAAGPSEALIESIAELAVEARSRGLLLTIEFLPGTGIPDLATAHHIASAAGADTVSVMFDTWHHARSGGTVGDLRQLPRGAIGGLQASDRVAPPAADGYRIMEDRLLPGRGELPLRALISAALANNPEVIIGVEVFSRELRAMAFDDAAGAALQALRAVIGDAATIEPGTT